MDNNSANTPIKVAMADDHVRYRTAIRQLLATKPDILFLGESNHGQELLELLKQVKPDVILLDLHMPVLDGITTLPLIRQQYPHIKVIILSMNNEHSLMAEVMQAGAHAYLSKTSEPEVIYQTIQACVNENFAFI